MKSVLTEVEAAIRASRRRWLVTGAAGFIGSHLVQALLALDQSVVGLDNFSTGRMANLDEVLETCSPQQRARFVLVDSDISRLTACHEACAGVDVVLHHAALCSVPGSIENPLLTHSSNVTGFNNLLLASRDARVKRVVYASSSAVYGNNPALPLSEDAPSSPLSPYAASKQINEICAQVFSGCYRLDSIGLRYFNVFGSRQDPAGAYAAVIPCWIDAMLSGRAVHIHGDGETSRDFCPIDNVIQANLLAATTENPAALNQVYNIALGERTSLNVLFSTIARTLVDCHQGVPTSAPVHGSFRDGDVRHSLADIGKARRLLGYSPQQTFAAGLAQTVDWYAQRAARRSV